MTSKSYEIFLPLELRRNWSYLRDIKSVYSSNSPNLYSAHLIYIYFKTTVTHLKYVGLDLINGHQYPRIEYLSLCFHILGTCT